MILRLLDASVILASEDADDVHHEAALDLMQSEDPLCTLDLALYEVANVAVRSWRTPPSANRMFERLAAIGADGGLVRADGPLLLAAVAIADEHGISAYDAAYVAAARRSGARLVSCDVRDLVSRGLADLP